MRAPTGGLVAMLCAILAGNALADQAHIEHVELALQDGRWQADVTLRHADTGWDHYADAWRLVDDRGNVLATRKLWHPHVEEQPFTRSKGEIKIPDSLRYVYVEAHDKVHGWNPDRVKVDLLQDSGERFRIRR